MNAVSERDADGNPVTQQEMFDTKWVALCLVIMLAALAKSAGAFAVQGKASAAVPQYRAGPVVMNAVSERDADGNPVTQQEMFDTKWVALCLVIMLAALAKSAGAF